LFYWIEIKNFIAGTKADKEVEEFQSLFYWIEIKNIKFILHLFGFVKNVSILVLLDRDKELIEALNQMSTKRSFNPCFIG